MKALQMFLKHAIQALKKWSKVFKNDQKHNNIEIEKISNESEIEIQFTIPVDAVIFVSLQIFIFQKVLRKNNIWIHIVI